MNTNKQDNKQNNKQDNAHSFTVPQLAAINPPQLYDPAPNGYSHTVIARGGRTAYIAGQGGEDAHGELAETFDQQVVQAYRNLGIALEAVGAQPDQVTKLTTYVVGYDPSLLAAMTAGLQSLFGPSLPAQTLVPVPRLALDGMLFEVDAVAVLA